MNAFLCCYYRYYTAIIHKILYTFFFTFIIFMLYVLSMLILCVKYQDLLFKTHLGEWKSNAFFIPDIIVTFTIG